MQRRMLAFIDGLLESFEKHKIESEFILVEWNPLPTRPLLRDEIEWPRDLNYCTIRIIEVPPAIHRRYKGHEKVRLNLFPAWNVGIRRARGEFVLPATIDLVYSEELIRFLASKNLNANAMYRIDRFDVDSRVADLSSLTERLNYCDGHSVCRHFFNPQDTPNLEPHLHIDCCGDFELMSRKCWYLTHGFNEKNVGSLHSDTLMCYQACAAGVREIQLREPMRLYHINHGHSAKMKWPSLHARRVLFGSPLPLPISSEIDFLYRRFLRRLEGVPQLFFDECLTWSRQMLDGKRSYAVNNEDWGLGNEVLDETTIRAKWDIAPGA